MKERKLENGVIEKYDLIIDGICVNCNEEFHLVIGSNVTRRTNNERFCYPKQKDHACVFRCNCGVVIEDHFKPYRNQ